MGSFCAVWITLRLGVMAGLAGVLLRGLYALKILIKSNCALEERGGLIVAFQTMSEDVTRFASLRINSKGAFTLRNLFHILESIFLRASKS